MQIIILTTQAIINLIYMRTNQETELIVSLRYETITQNENLADISS